VSDARELYPKLEFGTFYAWRPDAAPVRVGANVFVSNTSGCLNLRAGPALSQPALGCLPDGALGVVTDGPANAAGNNWWELGGRGWVIADHLTLMGTLPADPDPASIRAAFPGAALPPGARSALEAYVAQQGRREQELSSKFPFGGEYRSTPVPSA